MTTTDMRAEFEAWADDQPEFVVKDLQRYPDGQYGHATAQVAWAVWQAAYAAGRNAKREPLTEAEVSLIAERLGGCEPTDTFWKDFVRAIERAHGIGADHKEGLDEPVRS